MTISVQASALRQRDVVKLKVIDTEPTDGSTYREVAVEITPRKALRLIAELAQCVDQVDTDSAPAEGTWAEWLTVDEP